MANGRNRIKEALKINRRTFFNPSGWIDLTALRSLNTIIIDTIRGAFVVPKPGEVPPPETFSHAMKRMGVTEKDIASTAVTYRNFALGLAACGFLNLFYAFYLLFMYGGILGFIVAIATTLLFFAQAFRFDFWSLQLRKRKLGITFAEWKETILGKKGRNS